MSNASRWASAILAPLIALFAGMGWYLSRSVLFAYAMDAGLASEDVRAMHTTQSYVGMLGLVFAGVIAIALGPSLPLILGAGALSAGLLAVAVLPIDAAPLAFGLAVLGHGMIMPAIYGALARAFDGELESLRNAAFLVVVAALNVGGFASPLLGSSLREVGGTRSVFLSAGAFAAFALVLAAILGVIVLMTRKKEQPESSPARGGPRDKPAPSAGWIRAGVGAGLVVVCAVPWALSAGTAMWLLAPELRYGMREMEASRLDLLNPAVVIALSLLGAVVFVVLHALRSKVPALLVAGLGLAVLGVGAALSAALIDDDARLVTVGAVLVIGAIGEALFMPLLLSRATGDLPLRLETAVAAAWILAIRVIMMLTAFVSDEPSGQRALLWVGALAALVVGVGLAAASFPLRRVFALAEPAR